MTTPTQSLTLYNIEMQLLELLEQRDWLTTAPANEFTDEAERAEVLRETDQRIAEYLNRELRKVDGIVYTLLEFRRRADVEDDELKRIKARRDRWQAYHDRLEQQVIGAMQLANKTELRGERETLKLRKNPPAVDVRQPELVPPDYQRWEVKIPALLWIKLSARLEAEDMESVTVRPDPDLTVPGVMRSAILPVLKSTTPCARCEGIAGNEYCDDCHGSGKIQGAVPGCTLVQNVRLVIE